MYIYLAEDHKFYSHQFLIKIFGVCRLRFDVLSFYHKVVDDSVVFLSVMMTDLAKTHQVNVSNHTDHNGQDGKHEVDCQLGVVHFKLHCFDHLIDKL